MIRVLFFTCEPGGAEVLIPVIQAISKDQNFDVIILTYSLAIDRLQKKRIIFQEISPICKNDFSIFELYSPDVIVTSATSLPHKDLSEKYLWHNAKQKNIPTIAFLDQWQNYAMRFSGVSDNERLIFQPDYINCINDIGKKEMLKLGFNPSKLLKFGHPYLSTIKKETENINIHDLKNKLNIGDEYVFLFVSEAIKENYQNMRGYDQYKTLKLFLKFVSIENKQSIILIKLHPKDDLTLFKTILNKYTDLKVIVIQNELNSLEVIMLSDFVVGMTSIMLIEALILGKKVFSYQPDLCIDDPLIISKNNYILKSYSKDIKFNQKENHINCNFTYKFKKRSFAKFLLENSIKN